MRRWAERGTNLPKGGTETDDKRSAETALSRGGVGRRLAEGDRRPMTVLVGSLRGLHQLGAAVDPEAFHELVAAYDHVCRDVISRFGGFTAGAANGRFQALFGYPSAHGNDPERAVRGGLALIDEMGRVGARLGRPLQLAVGIATGQVVVADALASEAQPGEAVIGAAPHLAARLEALAEPCTVLVSEGTRALLGRWFELEEAACDELAVHRVLCALPMEWRERSEGSGRPFVGRRAELRQLEGALELCLRSGNGQPVHVRGEAGIGKTRLVAELRRRTLERGFACHTGLVLDFGTATGQDAIRALVRSFLGLGLGAAHEAAARAAAQSIDEGLVSEENRVYLNDLLDLPQPLALRALYDAMDNTRRNQGKRATVAGLLTNLSRRGPLLLVVEDVHWADRLTLEHLASLARTATDCPAVLVMTSRIEGDPLDQAWRQTIGASPLMSIDLGPLHPREAELLASAYIDASADLARRCLERAAGNPFFLEQLLSHAEESTETVPGSVQSLVQARVDQLEPADKAGLQAASVLGQRFALDALRHLLDQPGYSPARALEHHLIRPEGDTLLFGHSLVRDAIYDSLLRSRRRHLHRRAAAWFGQHDLILRADHLDRAGDAQAPEAYLEAARQQAAEYRMERALSMAERGLALATAPAIVHALSCLRGDLLRESGRVEHSIATFERALEAAADDAGRCAALIGLAAGMRIVDRIEDALTALDRAQVTATEQRLDHELSQIHYYRGNLYFPLGKIDDCLEQHALARRHAHLAGSVQDEARALSGLGDARYMRGHMITACENFDRCIEICQEHGLGRIDVANRPLRGVTRFYQNQLAPALDDALRGGEDAARVGNPRAEINCRCIASIVLADSAQFAASRDQAERALDLVRQLGARRFEPFPLFFMARLEALSGDPKLARSLAEDAVVIAREASPLFSAPWALGILALTTPEDTARRQALAEGETILRQDCLGHCYLWFYRLAMDACLKVGDWDAIERYAAALQDYTRPEPLPWSAFFIARGRALAAYGRGRRDEALFTHIRQLADDARKVGHRLALPALERVLASH